MERRLFDFSDVKDWRRTWRGDLFGGITAAIVALPLALAFGVASGLGAGAGLWGAIVLGFFAAALGGTPSQVSGPTGPMTVVTAGLVMQFADQPGVVFTIILLGGLMQVLFGVFRLGRYVALMPYPVISGFMSGIGVIIILLELPPLLGLPSASGGVIGSIRLLAAEAAHLDPATTALGVATLLLVIFWPKRLAGLLPGPLAALILGTLAALALVPDTAVLGAIPQGLPELGRLAFSWSDLPAIVQGALTLAALGTIDTLLTSLVADNLTDTEHRPNQELIGQGIGNALAGLAGGIPGAGATMRTVVNIRAGGRTRLSGMTHALVLLALVLGLAPLASHIPHAVLAGILLKVGWDIIDWHGLKQLTRSPGEGTFFMIIVFLLTVFVDLITAVGVGLFLAAILTIDRLSEHQLASIEAITDGESPHLDAEEREMLRRAQGRVAVFQLSGPFSFGAAKGMVRRLLAGQFFDTLVLDFARVPFLDSSAARAIDDVVVRLKAAGRRVLLAGLTGETKRQLAKMGVLARLEPEALVSTRREAIARATGDGTAAGSPAGFTGN